MKKRLLALSLALVMMLSATTVAQAAPRFNDVRAGDWFYSGVQYAAEQGLMNGTGNGMFSPNQSTTRGMIVTIIYRMEGEPAAALSKFQDVPSGQWYAKAVGWAAANKIVNGYSDTQFGPNDAITRQQMAAILYRYAESCGYDTSGRAALSGYSDYGAVAAYAKDAMAWAVDAGLINGTGGNMLSPQGTATRAQIAVILARFCEQFGGAEDRPEVEPPVADPEPPVVEPDPPVVDPSDEVTYEEYQAMTGEEQMAYMESFPSVQDFFAWYNEAKAKYDAEQDRIEIGGDGTIDIEDIINGKT